MADPSRVGITLPPILNCVRKGPTQPFASAFCPQFMGNHDISGNAVVAWCDFTKLGVLGVIELNRYLDSLKTLPEEMRLRNVIATLTLCTKSGRDGGTKGLCDHRTSGRVGKTAPAHLHKGRTATSPAWAPHEYYVIHTTLPRGTHVAFNMQGLGRYGSNTKDL